VNTQETYLAVVVTLLFVGGIGLLVAIVRERTRLRKQWSGRGWRELACRFGQEEVCRSLTRIRANRKERFLFTMSERQCPECGGELGLAVRPSRAESATAGATTSLSTRWRCSTCGCAFTAEQVRQGNRVRL